MKKNEPPLTENEEILLYSQGAYKNYQGAGWKLGHHYLTNKRLIFLQPSGVAFETLLPNIRGITVEKKPFIIRSKNAICISYRHTNAKWTSKALIIMKELGLWRKKLYEMTLVKIDEESLNKVAQELDSDSREILRYLWDNRHAQIDELARLIDAPNHMRVLMMIRQHINQIAERIIGNSVLTFEKSKIDEETGEKVLFSWWIIGRERAKEKKEVLWDIFDEKDCLTIIMELVGVQEEDIQLKAGRDMLTIAADTPDTRYYEEIPLSAAVNTEELTKIYKNNILQIKLQKE